MDTPCTTPPPMVSPGFTEAERDLVARLFWQAFQGKLSRLLRPEAKAVSFIASVLDPAFAIAARDQHGMLLGVAGFKTADGALVGGKLRDLAQVYGTLGALWRGLLLSILERDIEPGVFLMDGIFVTEAARGRGVGTALLDAIKATARARGIHSVRLDVIDTNPRARALYERQGFVAGPVTRIGPLRHLFGFHSSTEMRCDLR